MESEDRQSAFDRRNEKCDHVVFRLISVSWEDLTGIYKIKIFTTRNPDSCNATFL